MDYDDHNGWRKWILPNQNEDKLNKSTREDLKKFIKLLPKSTLVDLADDCPPEKDGIVLGIAFEFPADHEDRDELEKLWSRICDR